MSLPKLIIAATVVLASQAYAQSTSGTLVVVPAFGEVKHANDQATMTFGVEEQDKDKAAAASRVNQKIKQGLEILRREDPQASIKTQGYYTYPVYPERRPLADGTMPKLLPTGWRVGNYVEMKTTNLGGLPKTVAAGQKVLALNNLQFGLSPATTKKLDDQRIAATYQNLNERIASIAAAMGRKPGDAVLDTVDFEGSGNYVNRVEVAGSAPQMMARRKKAENVAEPTFEPGETPLQNRPGGKVKIQ